MATVNPEIIPGHGGTGRASQADGISSSSGWGMGAQTIALAATCFLVPMALGGEPGSGGAVTPEAALTRHQWLQDDSIDVTSAVKGEDDAELFTPAERLERIRQLLGLTITDLARLLDTTRPTVYAWLNGQEPRPEVHTRLIRLERQAENIAACDLPRINKLIRRPLRCGGSLLDRLREDDPLQPALEELQSLAQREHSRRMRHKGKVIATRSSREALDDIAVPLRRG
ncbi:MAG TPA: helix-turn-helix transcriptional regulator [Halomonas sp.]|nr:helix-turn-helix transcriptional regulator [Halomonas sp.]